MVTTDENKAIRQEESRQVAQDAAEAYRAAVSGVLGEMRANREQTALLEVLPLPRGDYQTRRRKLRDDAKELAKTARAMGIERTRIANALGVSRQTIHEWLNEGES